MHTLAALGGTFDRFHKGHKALLDRAFMSADRVVAGITTDEFIVEKVLCQIIEPFEVRKQAVLDYACKIGKGDNINIVELSDVFGPTLNDTEIDCLIVSPLTQKGAQVINAERIKHSLSPLPVQVCHVELSSDGQAISSTRIRKGEINREGFVYASLLQSEITLHTQQKNEVKHPFGTIYKDVQALTHVLETKVITAIVTVGDTATRIFLENGIPLTLGVFDNYEQRKRTQKPIAPLLTHSCIQVDNAPGTVSAQLSQAIRHAIDDSNFIEVNGEEDLAVIPLTLLLPLESSIIYGQPDEGLVLVEVTEEKKEWVRSLLTSCSK